MTTAVEESAAPALTFADVLARVRRRPVVFALPIVLGLAASLAYVFLAPKTYVARAAVQVQPVVSDQYGPVNLAQVVNMATEQQVAQSSSVVSIAAKALGTTADDVQDSVSVDSPQDTQVLNVRYSAGSAAAAARGAQMVAESYLGYRTDATKNDANKRLADIASRIATTEAKLKSKPGVSIKALQSDLDSFYSQRRQLDNIVATPVGRIITDAAEPTAPASPRLTVDVPLGLAVGLIVGLALAVLLPSRQRREVAAPTRVTAPRRARDGSGKPSEFDQMLAAAQHRPAPPSAAPATGPLAVSVVPGAGTPAAPAPAPAPAPAVAPTAAVPTVTVNGTGHGVSTGTTNGSANGVSHAPSNGTSNGSANGATVVAPAQAGAAAFARPDADAPKADTSSPAPTTVVPR